MSNILQNLVVAPRPNHVEVQALQSAMSRLSPLLLVQRQSFVRLSGRGLDSSSAGSARASGSASRG